MPAFLHCCLCGLHAVDGFLSRYAWGYVESNPHGTLQVCPECLERHHDDWEDKAIAAAGASGESQEARRSQSSWY